jgi:hypothetical protein
VNDVKCGCGRQYSSDEWIALPYVGVMADEVEVVELRNCVCGSTIGVVLGSEEIT